MEKVAFGIQKL